MSYPSSDSMGSRIPKWKPLQNGSLVALAILFLFQGCNEPSGLKDAPTSPDVTPSVAKSRPNKYLQSLSEYGLFEGTIARLKPAKGVIEYDVNTPSFADYSVRQRVIRIPEGKSAKYDPVDVLDFPVGTIISKTFYYLRDMTDTTQGRRLVETRILLRNESGWIGLPYVWNDEETDAILSLAGATVDVSWIHHDGKVRSNAHIVPNLNDCKRCHQNESMAPLGPKARNLNQDFEYDHGTENQLSYLARIGLLQDVPNPEAIPKLAVWDDSNTGSLDARARAWLEVNCSHCHNPKGPAKNSGLHLSADVKDRYQLGVFKTPVAAGKGTGGRLYGIVPGKPDESIMLYRLETTHPGAMMPEFGRSLVHEESVALIREWIATMSE